MQKYINEKYTYVFTSNRIYFKNEIFIFWKKENKIMSTHIKIGKIKTIHNGNVHYGLKLFDGVYFHY